MESRTKRQVTNEELLQMVEAAFGQGMGIASAIELTDGWYNTAYRIRLSNGRETVLKIAPPKNVSVMTYERDLMRAEVEVSRLIRKQTTVPMPEICYVSIREKDEPVFFFMNVLEGAAYHTVKEHLSQDTQAGIEREIGEISRQINEITGSAFGYFNNPVYPRWSEAFTEMIRLLFQDAAVVNCPLPFTEQEFAQPLALCATALDQVTDPRLVYWDLWDGNIFVQDGNVTGIIDAERALWGDPLMDYPFRGGEQASDAFYEGYGRRFQSEEERLRRNLYDIYFGMILVIETRYRDFSSEHEAGMRSFLESAWDRFNHIDIHRK